MFLPAARAATDRETTEAPGEAADRGAGTGARLSTFMSSYVSPLKVKKI